MAKKNHSTITDIARELNITPSTVSRALNDHPRISQQTKQAVWQAAQRMNYQSNHLAAALRRGTSLILGVMVPTANRNFFSNVIRGVEEIAKAAGYAVIICQSNDAQDQEAGNIDVLLRTRVDGILASVGRETRDHAHFQRVIDRGTPLILFDRVQEQLPVSTVVVDDYLGAYQATGHLLARGYRRIAHFAGPQHLNIYRERRRGYEQALADAGQHNPLALSSALQLEDGYRLAAELIGSGQAPDAIFSASDFAALGAMQYCKEQGIAIPDRLALAGFSNESFTAYLEPALTTVDQCSEEMGRIAARLLIEQIQEQDPHMPRRRTVLTPRLIVRAST
ncbi:MAG: LacI family DNA-binding transcriptional regulator [Bacteroidia bacterium]